LQQKVITLSQIYIKLETRMKITVETNGEVITMELHDDNTIWELIPKLKILLTFCGYSEDLINQIIEEQE